MMHMRRVPLHSMTKHSEPTQARCPLPDGAPRAWVAYAVVALVALLEHRAILRFHLEPAAQTSMVTAAWGVVVGEPHWAEYQPRLLGPWLVRALSATGWFGAGMNGFGRAFVALLLILTLAKSLILTHVSLRLHKSVPSALARTLVAVAAFGILQVPEWLYLWDHLDVIVFSLFLYGALAKRGILYFCLLFVVAILNRQSGLFVALWLLADGLWRRNPATGRIEWMTSWRRSLVGAGLLVTGLGLIHCEQTWLLVREVAREDNPAFVTEGAFHLTRNLRTIGLHVLNPNWTLGFLPGLVVLVALAISIRALVKADDFMSKQALLLIAMLSSVLLFGLVNETRVFTMFIPFAALLPYRWSRS